LKKQLTHLSNRIHRLQRMRFQREQEKIEELDEMQKFIKHLRRQRKMKIVEACYFMQKEFKRNQRRKYLFRMRMLEKLIKNEEINKHTLDTRISEMESEIKTAYHEKIIQPLIPKIVQIQKIFR